MKFVLLYFHIQNKSLMDLKIFATVHNLKDINLIDSYQAHLPVQYALNIKFIHLK